MARARNIKPTIMDNEGLADLPPYARLLFIYLWMLADREGRLEDRPRRIKARAFPYEEMDVDALLWSLHEGGFLLRYESKDVKCIQVVNFSKHQNPHSREQVSSLPPPEKEVARHGLGGDKEVTSPADSLIPSSLIPSSLNNTMSGTARRLLDHLNEKAGKNFKPVPANIHKIEARLKEFDEETLRRVVDDRCTRWREDEKMAEYLRPATLFNATRCAQYAGELDSAAADPFRGAK